MITMLSKKAPKIKKIKLNGACDGIYLVQDLVLGEGGGFITENIKQAKGNEWSQYKSIAAIVSSSLPICPIHIFASDTQACFALVKEPVEFFLCIFRALTCPNFIVFVNCTFQISEGPVKPVLGLPKSGRYSFKIFRFGLFFFPFHFILFLKKTHFK
jgi:hypothetical protein